MRRAILLSIAVLGLGAGCGGGSSSNNPPGDDAPTPDGAVTTPDAPDVPPGYTRLLGRTWSLQPGQLDTYRCVRFTVPEDMYITSIIAQAPPGTHHTVLTFAGANGTSGADGEQDCSVGTLGTVMIYASGVGTDPLDFPDGVGVKLSAGQQIHLNIHLFNATDNPLAGDTAILVKSQSTPTPQLAEMAFAGAFRILLQANPTQTQTVTGGCQADSDFHLFAVWPHQHTLGTHQKLVITHNGTPNVLHDDVFDFNEQKYYLQTPEFVVSQGDHIDVTCSWINDTGHIVTFGDSTNDEMCFAGMYRYPAQGANLFSCTDTGGI